MSEFAFFRFKSNNMLTLEEEQQKVEIIKLTEEVLEAKGIECDSRISKISEKQLREILEVFSSGYSYVMFWYIFICFTCSNTDDRRILCDRNTFDSIMVIY
jgi:hypothetical protein